MKFYSHSKVISIKYHFSILRWSISNYIYHITKKKVLVPFDIGVVYIQIAKSLSRLTSFSPLRYWGGLYQYEDIEGNHKLVLVPFDIGVVYIRCKMFSNRLKVLVPFDIGVVYIRSYFYLN